MTQTGTVLDLSDTAIRGGGGGAVVVTSTFYAMGDINPPDRAEQFCGVDEPRSTCYIASQARGAAQGRTKHSTNSTRISKIEDTKLVLTCL